jgi:hypothetical protein
VAFCCSIKQTYFFFSRCQCVWNSIGIFEYDQWTNDASYTTTW